MKTIKLEIEHPLMSTSRNIVWKLIGTAPGLACWIADRVELEGDTLTLSWGDEWRHHETRSATVLVLDRYKCIRWRWDDDPDDTYVEIRMDRIDISGGITLHITDFTPEDDKEWLYSTWQHNFDRLRMSSGV